MSMILSHLEPAGLAYAIDQIVDLVTQDVAGVHLYTMNNAETASSYSRTLLIPCLASSQVSAL